MYVFIPVSIILNFLNLNLFCFIATVLSIIPLSYSICNYTEKISKILGEKIGGLINATTGNIPELFICYFALNAGMYDLVKSGIIGSIICNILFVQGVCILFGGIKYVQQSFNKNLARTNFGLLFLALCGIIIASIFNQITPLSYKITYLSFGISLILIIIYLLGLFFSLFTHRNLFTANAESYITKNEINNSNTKSQLLKYFIYLLIISIFIAYESEILVKMINFISIKFSISQSFLGIILVPLVGNISEYTTAIIMALKNKVNLYIEIAVGSGIQIALFVAPLLTILGFIILKPLNLVYNIYHIASLMISVGLSFFVFQDGKTYWLEGAILIASYLIIAMGYYFM